MIGDQGDSLTPKGLIARRALRAGQCRFKVRRRSLQTLQVLVERNIAPCIPLLGHKLRLHGPRQVAHENLSQPGQELALARTAKLTKVAASVEESLLDQIGRIHSPLEMQIDLRPRQEQQVIAVQLQEGSQT